MNVNPQILATLTGTVPRPGTLIGVKSSLWNASSTRATRNLLALEGSGLDRIDLTEQP